MKIAFIGYFSAFHTETEIADYLELAGHEVDRYQFNPLNLNKFVNRAGSYDIVITSLPQCFDPGFWGKVKRQGPELVAWYFDWIEGLREEQYLSALREFDLVLSTDGFENDVYRGLNRVWLPHACDPRTYHPVEGRPSHDVGFIGHVYTAERRDLLGGLTGKYDFHLCGTNEECWGPGYAQACASVKIMVGDNFKNDIPGYWSDRLYLSMACGAFLIYPRVEGIEDYFKDGKHLVLYDDETDLHDKIDYYLPLEDKRKKIAMYGSEHTRLNHSWRVRVEKFESICASAL